MKKINELAIVNSTKEAAKKVVKSKGVKIAGATVAVAAITVAGVIAYNKLRKKSEVPTETQKFDNDEMELILDVIKHSEPTVATLKGFGIDAGDITIEDCISNDGMECSFEFEGIVIRYTQHPDDSFVIDVFRDPLYDFMMQPQE